MSAVPVTAQGIVNDVRVMSGLRNNQLFSDAQILELVNDALDELSDKFIASLGHWFRKTADFTLAGNAAGDNTFDLTTLPDFQMDQGVNWYPGGYSSPPVPVNRLGSFAERGRGMGTVALGYVGAERVYYTNGNLLFIDPFTASSGQYRLIYTPQKTPLAFALGVDVESAQIVIPTTGGNVAFSSTAFLDATSAPWLATDAGDSVVVTGAINSGNNGAHVIGAYDSPTRVTLIGTYTPETLGDGATVNLFRQSRVDGAGNWTFYGNNPFSNPTIAVNVGDVITVKGTPSNDGSYTVTQAATGGNAIATGGVTTHAENFPGIVTVTVQPAGTAAALSALLAPWALYLKLHTSIAIRNSRSQPIADLQPKLLMQEKRIAVMSSLRSEGPKQAPITNLRRGRRGLRGYFG